MKTRKFLFYSLMFLPLAAALIALQFLPEQIPAHYDFQGQVTRWGSKYEALIFPVFTIAFGFFILAMARYAAKQEQHGRNNETVSIITGIASLLLFNALTGYSLWTDFQRVEALSSQPFDLYQLTCGILGLFLLIVGNVMPKLRMNSVIGLRTSWSMKNETTWKKSQKFGGISLLAAGVLILIVSFLVRGFLCFVWAMGILLLTVLIDVVYSYNVAKKY